MIKLVTAIGWENKDSSTFARLMVLCTMAETGCLLLEWTPDLLVQINLILVYPALNH